MVGQVTQSLYRVAVQLGMLAGLGEILRAGGKGFSLILLGCDEARVASRTKGGLQPLPPLLNLLDRRGRSVVEGSYVSKRVN